MTIYAHLKSTAFRLPGLLILLAALLIGTSLEAQIKKGERLFKEGRYEEAAKALKKDFFGKKPDEGSGLLLAQTYYQLKRYADARDIMDLIQDQYTDSIEVGLFYTDVLIANDDYSVAYLHTISLLSEHPTHPTVYLWLNKIRDLLRWDTISTGASFIPIAGINTVYNEYAPYAHNDALWYITDINSMQAVFPASYSGQNLHLIYKTQFERSQKEVTKPTMLVKDRKYYNHDGPLSKWPNRQLYAVTMRDVDAPVTTSTIGIFFIDLDEAENPMPFRYNESYNTGHPTFNESGTRMWFASDRPGGYGAMDIWYCDWENGQWGAPINMGPGINSPANEVFSRYHEGRLYFSSDRRDQGHGGLDLYFASEMRDFKTIYNLRQPINSAYDDFALSMQEYDFGFFTSNRVGGAGGDDIYSCLFITEKIEHQELTAKFKGEPIEPGTRVVIYNGKNEVAKETTVLNDNFFSLGGLFSNETYTVKLPELGSDTYEIHVVNSNGEIADVFTIKEENTFRIELLDPEDYQMGTSNAEDVTMALYDLEGRLHAEGVDDWTGTDVSITDQRTGKITEVSASPDGMFTAGGMMYDSPLQISTTGEHKPDEIDIYGSSGAIIQSIIPVGPNDFSFTRQAPEADWMLADEVEGVVIAAMLSEGNWANSRFILEDVLSSEQREVVMDEDGFIHMGTLRTLRSYKLTSPDKHLANDDFLGLLDGGGEMFQRVRPSDSSSYLFEYLVPDEPDEPQKVITEARPFQGLNYQAAISGYTGIPNFMLLKDQGQRKDTVMVDENGRLLLHALEQDQKYTLSAITSGNASQPLLTIFDPSGAVLKTVPADENNAFVFTLLEEEEYSMGKSTAADVAMSTFDLSGQILETGGEIKAMKLLNTGQVPIAEIYTATDGSFLAKNIESSDSFIVQIAETGEDAVWVKNPGGSGYFKGKYLGDDMYLFDLLAEAVPEIIQPEPAPEAMRREFTVPHVYYRFNSYYLMEESRRSLDMLTRYLRQNTETEIEIRSYTDARGTADYNQLLSERRAEAVKDYLIRKGIEARRLQTRGFGESQLVNACNDEVECTEEEHAANRRTTFVLLKD